MSTYHVPKDHHLHPRYATDALRNQEAEATLAKNQLIFPIFITDEPGAKEPIGAMPGNYRWGPDNIVEAVGDLIEKGLESVLIFGVPKGDKDPHGSTADSPETPAITSVQNLRAAFPELTIMNDVCLCAYTDHGHCGILNDDGTLDNEASVNRLAEVALAYAQAGSDVVAPSDMMDGRIGAIRDKLKRNGMEHKHLMSYAAKFASCFYGPFRDAAQSSPSFGDRRCYQLPPAARKLALDAVDRDLAEGADSIMVKPAGPYMDIIREIKDRVSVPTSCYQVSGEFAMIHHAAEAGAFDRKTAILESLISLRRAGSDTLITYFTPEVLEWI